MHLQALRYLVAVADEGHFGRAAAAMHVSQPSVSQAVLRLEQQLGATLLDRSGSRVVPTDAGQRVIDEVRIALRHLDRAVGIAREPGPLRIACTPFFSMWVTVQLLTPFREAHPEVQVSVAERDVPAQLRGLLAGEIDLAVGEPLGPHEALRQTVVREDPCAVWTSMDHPLTVHEEVPLVALAGIPVSDGDPILHPGYHEWIRATFAAAGVTPTFAPPGQDSPSTVSRVIDGSVVALAADIVPEGGIPGVAVRRVSDDARWQWTTTVPREQPHASARAFTAWARGYRGV